MGGGAAQGEGSQARVDEIVPAYDRVAKLYDEFYARPEYEAADRRLWDRLRNLTAGVHVLDLGCGTGLFLDLFRRYGKRHDAPRSYYGLDPSPGMIERARAKHPRAEFAVADLAGAPAGRYGAVTALYGPLSYVPDLGAALASIAALLRPGGALAAIVYSPEHRAHADIFELLDLPGAPARRYSYEELVCHADAWREAAGDELRVERWSETEWLLVGRSGPGSAVTTEAPTPDLDLLRGFVAGRSWTFAKTMAALPHWYTVRSGGDPPFAEAVSTIRRYGYRRPFYRSAFISLDLDGWTYWTMGAPLDETTIINRAPHPASPESAAALARRE